MEISLSARDSSVLHLFQLSSGRLSSHLAYHTALLCPALWAAFQAPAGEYRLD